VILPWSIQGTLEEGRSPRCPGWRSGLPLTTSRPATYRRLADLAPRQLAIMHASAYTGDCPALLRAMADVYEQQFGCGAAGIPAKPLPGHDGTVGS